MAYGFDVDRLLVWLAPRDPTAATRCAPARCASATPTRWWCRWAGRSTTAARRRRGCSARTGRRGRDARRPTGPAEPPPSRRRPSRAAPVPAGSSTLDEATPPSRSTPAPTVAEVTGAPLADDDPDATVAIPWLPDVRRRRRPRRRAGRSQPAARPGVPRHRPPALMHTTVELLIPDADAGRPVRAGRHARPLPGVDAARPPRRPARARRRPAGVARPAAGPGRSVRPLEAAAHGAHGVRAGRRARFERIQDDDRDHAEWVLTATVADADGGATVVTDLHLHGVAVGVGRAAADPRRRDPARQGRPGRPRQRRAHALSARSAGARARGRARTWR